MQNLYEYFKKLYPDLLGDKDIIELDWGTGWKDILDILFAKLSGRGIKITQVKEKFGGLRVYYDPWGVKTEEDADLVDTFIQQAEEESLRTCQFCGSKNNVSTKGSWLLTLCDSCREKRGASH